MSVRIENLDSDKYIVFIAEKNIGYIEKYYNPFHCYNCYLKLNLTVYDKVFSQDIFQQIAQQEKKNLQIMLDSSDKEKIVFIESGGFCCKRRCYEVELTLSDLIYKNKKEVKIKQCQTDDARYILCARMMYEYYGQTHALINPLTSSFSEFLEHLPKRAFYYADSDKIKGVIFVEANEIAYCYFEEESSCFDFSYAVISRLFSQYETIFFEADDVDASAMKLVAMFDIDLKNSFNTYIK